MIADWYCSKECLSENERSEFSDRHFVIKERHTRAWLEYLFASGGMGRYSGQARVWRRWGSCVRVRIADCLNDKLSTPILTFPRWGGGRNSLLMELRFLKLKKWLATVFRQASRERGRLARICPQDKHNSGNFKYSLSFSHLMQAYRLLAGEPPALPGSVWYNSLLSFIFLRWRGLIWKK